MYYLGVDLGGTNIKAALVDADGAIIKEASTPTKLPRPAEAVCDDIAALCNQLAQGQQVAGIGVGCPGTWMAASCATPTIWAGMILPWGIICAPKPACRLLLPTMPTPQLWAKHWRAALKEPKAR